ncbi:MAG: hypothetical protein DKM50_12375 [Candidatus Margulisiibacteriota bacterium]|nr:MAG: hypothetical protein A2X43_04955 [Candidatus Margulisbacteria bacterium GWD2_39_127]OGI03609.1 MAG: hypothetical protein A2X42_01100 [Candidatus Margulisbacteria bacterium GWF2_38_17]OGI11113.1 MAG: hypothetical protein A2X41_02395 [Candidatus Margulisbacteria bacterium GWE2_39_32]PZM78138.1 MAG: hypothetical protein DKM50_12375 [Candidatus Margulisiibacteriota bacterium]HAR64378.1 hypothetical protein [Candidatus Margulisiibacteriota bacterium]
MNLGIILRLNSREIFKYSLLVGILATFIDAVIAHGIWRGTDPYWTYWVTNVFLFSTVFSIGATFWGVGLRQGLVLSFFSAWAFAFYYDYFAPLGLPQESWWLESRDLWTAGFVTCYLVVLAGYLISLWMWLRIKARKESSELSTLATCEHVEILRFTVIASLAVLIVDGLITQGLLFRHFPGVTFYFQRFLLSYIVLYFWTVYIGFEKQGIFSSAFLLSLIWTGYSMYLGPVDLPLSPPRYLNYIPLWLKVFPGSFLSIFTGIFILSRLIPQKKPNSVVLISAVFVSIIALGNPLFASEGLFASAAASGSGSSYFGADPYNLKIVQPMIGSIKLQVNDIGNRESQVKNNDKVNIVSNFMAGNSAYRVVITRAMPRHPLGTYPVWMGVAFNPKIHGMTGIGTSKLPEIIPEIAVWGWAEVWKDGKLISKMVPAQVTVIAKGATKGITLEVGAEEKDLVGDPAGYIHVRWPKVSSVNLPVIAIYSREMGGWIVLIAINLAFLWLIIDSPYRIKKKGFTRKQVKAR